MPDSGNEQATTAKRPSGLGGSDELWSIVGLVSQALVVGEAPAKLRIIPLALVDQRPHKLCLDKRVPPLPGRTNPLAQQRRNRRLEAGIVAPVGAAIVPAIDEFAFCGQQALIRLGQINRDGMFHALAL